MKWLLEAKHQFVRRIRKQRVFTAERMACAKPGKRSGAAGKLEEQLEHRG